MANFEYIVSSLPVLTREYSYSEGMTFGSVLDEIRSDLDGRDNEAVDFLLKGFDSDSLGDDFYARAIAHPVPFIREYFRFDLNLRNEKVRWLNKTLSRHSDQDIITGYSPDSQDADIDGFLFTGGEFPERDQALSVLSLSDLIEREKGLDDMMWSKIDELTLFHYFDLTAVLGFISRLHIVDRWLVLDPETGKERFRKLVKDLESTSPEIRYNER